MFVCVADRNYITSSLNKLCASRRDIDRYAGLCTFNYPTAYRAWCTLQVLHNTGLSPGYIENVGYYVYDQLDKIPIDLTHLDFDKGIGATSGSEGVLPKAVEYDIYYKASSMDRWGLIGREAVNECIAGDVCDALRYNHLHYDLLFATIRLFNKPVSVWITSSKNYKGSAQRLTLGNYLGTSGVDIYNGEEVLKYIVNVFSRNLSQSMWEMSIVDFIINNTDRHSSNIELLQDSDGLHLAPIFDCGTSLSDDKESTHNFIGSPVLYEAIKMWPPDYKLPAFNWDATVLLKYVDAVPSIQMLQNINDLIKSRWEWLCAIRNS